MLRIGVLVNPIAGLGGTSGLKGSDGVAVQALARARGGVAQAAHRLGAAFEVVRPHAAAVQLFTWAGTMGADALAQLDFDVTVLGAAQHPSSGADSQAAVRAMIAQGIDLLVFAGGDGTARDLTGVVPPHVPVIGIPAGVKMHSAVFAVTPHDAGELIVRLITGGLVAAERADVRDIDEDALRQGRIAPRYYGELWVPRVGGYLQHVKTDGRENEALVLEEIASAVGERLADHAGLVVLGAGSTLLAIKARLGLASTLLAIDLWRRGVCVGHDVDAAELDRQVDSESILILSFTRGQGFLVGRGNQPLIPSVLRRLARANIWIVGSRSKLASLESRALLVDSGAADVDQKLSGIAEIISGYEDTLLYRVGHRPQ